MTRECSGDNSDSNKSDPAQKSTSHPHSWLPAPNDDVTRLLSEELMRRNHQHRWTAQ
jgi:hypothetical protein